MDVKKITQLSVKIGRTQKNKTPQYFYDYIIKNNHISHFFSNLSGEEFVIFCFMSSAVSSGINLMELGELFENIKKNIFVFSLGDVTDDYVDETCSTCGGDAELQCGYCGGSGNINCEDCDGNGEIEDDEGGYVTCNNCDGDGEISCDECNRGYVRCDDCDGNGEIEKEGYISVRIEEYVSYDSEIFNELEIMEDETKIENELSIKAIDSELTFNYRTHSIDTDAFPSESEKDDTYFITMEKYPKFSKTNKNLVYSNMGHSF